MSNQIFYIEYFVNDKDLKNRLRVPASDKVKLNSDKNAYSNNTKIIKNKKVSQYYFIIFLIVSIIFLKNKICKFVMK